MWGYISLYAELIARLIDSVTINQVEQIDGKIIKRRKAGRGWLIWAGNLFLRWSNSRIEMFPRTRDWQCWEYECYQWLYGGGCDRLGKDTLLITPFVGQSIRDMIRANTVTNTVLKSVAIEFHRTHQLDDWSHGDPHTGNVLWHEGRARLIDFETRHRVGLPSVDRHADDLLVFLLDLIGRTPSDNWFEHSQVFLLAYNNLTVLRTLRRRLHKPTGFELILWKTRTNFLDSTILNMRINQLHDWIGTIS